MEAPSSPATAAASEAARSASADRLEQVFDLAPSFLAVLSGPDHVFARVNRAYLELVGRRELIGLPVAHAMPEVVEQGFIAILDGVYHTGEPFVASELPVRLNRHGSAEPEERIVTFVYQPMRGPEGEIEGIVAHGVDVTSHVRGLEALEVALEAAEQSQERFRAVTSATKDVVWDWDIARGRVWRNDNVESVLGVDAERMANEVDGWSRRIHPEDRERVQASLSEALRDGSMWTAEYRFMRDDGTTAYLLDRGQTVRSKEGEPVRMIGSITDLTQRHHLEEELRQAQKMEAIGKLAGGIAHDFNNLLTVITNISDMLLEDLKGDEAVRGDLEEIGKAANRAAALTRQLLAFGRRQVLQPRHLDLNEVVGDIQKLLRRVIGEDIALVFQAGDDLRSVHADPGQIEQVILNLALNARDAMPSGGTLTVSTDNVNVGAREAREAGAHPGEYVRLSVRDTGVGMTAANRSQAFDPFFTTKPVGEGTGLGLSTAYGIVTQSRGFIDVESAPGAGAVFHIYLPVETGGAPSNHTVRSGYPAGPGKGTILLVEDEAAVRAVAKRALTRHGYTVLEASNGEEALELFGKATGTIDLVITDLVMPVMGGVELTERLSRMSRTTGSGSSVPVVFMSGYAEGDMMPDHALARSVPFLEKPFTVEQLVRAVAAAI